MNMSSGSIVVRRLKDRIPVPVKHNLKRAATAPLGMMAATRTNHILNVEGARKFLVSAPRRSGHHAVVNWMMNSLEGVPVDWVAQSAITFSPSSSVVFVNDLQERIDHLRHLEVARSAKAIEKAKAVILNVEDVDLSKWDSWRFALSDPDYKIYVNRAILDLVASRVRHAAKMHVDETLMKMLTTNREHLNSWTVIDFHRWLEPSGTHRRQILDELGLEVDIMPGTSPYGGGSSFTGVSRVPTAAELTHRHLQIEWTRSLIDLLLDRNYRDLLEPRELEFLQERSRRLRD